MKLEIFKYKDITVLCNCEIPSHYDAHIIHCPWEINIVAKGFA